MVNFVSSNIIAKGHSRFTVLSMRLSSGLRFGSQLEERIPVPQLSASVFLQSKYHSQPLEGTHTKFFQNTMRSLQLSNTIYWHIWIRGHRFHLCLIIFTAELNQVFQTFYRYICNVLDLSKKAARSRLSRTLCLTPAQRWQFISCPRVMKTPDPSTTPTTEKQGDLSSESVTQMTQSELINNSDGHGVSDRLVLFRPHLQSAPVSLQGRPLCREQDGNGSRSGWWVRRAEPLCLLPRAHRNGSPRTEAERTPPSSLALGRDIKKSHSQGWILRCNGAKDKSIKRHLLL